MDGAARPKTSGSAITLRGTTLRLGSRGEPVRRVQERLRTLGYDPGPVDGVYGWLTFGAVRDFQRDFGLDADGVAGRRTMAVLFDGSLSAGRRWSVVAEPAVGRGGASALRTLRRHAAALTAVATPARLRASDEPFREDDASSPDADVKEAVARVKDAVGASAAVWAVVHNRQNDLPGQYPERMLQMIIHSRRGVALFERRVFDAAQTADVILIDVGRLRWGDGPRFVGLLKRLARELAAERKQLAVSLPLRDLDRGLLRLAGDIDYGTVGALASFVVLTPPLRVSSVDSPRPPSPAELARALRSVVRRVPPWRCLLTVPVGVLALPAAAAPARALPYHYARALAYGAGQRPRWDEKVGRAVFSCRLEERDVHMWLETEAGFAAKLALVRRFRLGGVYLAGVGHEDALLWRPLRRELRRLRDGMFHPRTE